MEEGDKVTNAAAPGRDPPTQPRRREQVRRLQGETEGRKGQPGGRRPFPLGEEPKVQRVEGNLSQQPLIGLCSLGALSDWTVCSGRCAARQGGADCQGFGAGSRNWGNWGIEEGAGCRELQGRDC